MHKAERHLAVRLPMMPRDASELGNISGGVILSQIDLAAAIVSRRACKNMRIKRMVTRAMNEVEFKHPVLVGDVLCCYGSIKRIGNTSVTVLVEVEVDRRGEIIPVTEASAVFVALDGKGKPTPICGRRNVKKTPAAHPQPERIAAAAPPVPHGEKMLALKKVMMPNETNGMGNIFGGLLMTYMDWAGSYTARRACKNHIIARCVTRFMDKIEFKEPVHVSDILSCYGSVTKIGNTSVSVHVEVEADRAGKIIPVTQAELVFVAVDKRGMKVPVCPDARVPARKRAAAAARRRKNGGHAGKSKNSHADKPSAGCGCKR